MQKKFAHSSLFGKLSFPALVLILGVLHEEEKNCTDNCINRTASQIFLRDFLIFISARLKPYQKLFTASCGQSSEGWWRSAGSKIRSVLTSVITNKNDNNVLRKG
jgi:hypothetical protein